MQWKHIIRFNDFEPADLYSALKLRQDVFIIEQGCNYNDLDGIDLHSEHILLFQKVELVAYSRIVPGGIKYEVPSIGRIVVNPAYRGKGFGKKIVRKAVGIVRNKHQGKIKIEAQQYLLRFYESLGFKKISDSYDVDGIPHIEMIQ
jgi:ElaA protein